MSASRIWARSFSCLPLAVLAFLLAGPGCGDATFHADGTSAGSGGSGDVAGRADEGGAGTDTGGAPPSGGSAGSQAGSEARAGAPAGGHTSAGAAGTSHGGRGSAGASGGGRSGGGGGGASGGRSGSGGASGGGRSGGGGAGGGSGGAGPVPDATCPTDPPGDEPCVTGLSCSYGDDLRPRCRSRYQCENGSWTAQLAKCTALIACIDRMGGIPHANDACTDVGEDCTLDNGANGKVYCRCDACSGVMCKPTWECAGPPTGCPLVVPNEGQPCDVNGTSCQYGNCNMANGLQVQCTKKTWRWQQLVCPAL